MDYVIPSFTVVAIIVTNTDSGCRTSGYRGLEMTDVYAINGDKCRIKTPLVVRLEGPYKFLF